MERTLLLFAGGIGFLLWACSQWGFRSVASDVRENKSSESKYFWMLALALPVMGFIVSTPSNPPLFAAGHGLGTGFLIGGLAAALACWFFVKAHFETEENSAPSLLKTFVAPAGLALAVSTIPSLFLRDVLEDAFSGVAIGWLVSASAIYVGHLGVKETEVRSRILNGILLSTGIAILLCSVMFLGELRGGMNLPGKISSSLVHWSASAAVFASLSLLILYIVALPEDFVSKIPFTARFKEMIAKLPGREDKSQSRWEQVVLAFAAALTLLAGKITADRFPVKSEDILEAKDKTLKALMGLMGTSALFQVIFVGVFAGLLIHWIIAGTRGSESGDSREAIRRTVVSCLVVLAGSIFAMQRLGGLGVGMMLVAMVPMQGVGFYRNRNLGLESDPAPATFQSQLIPRVLAFGILILLYRLISVRYSTLLRGVGLTDNFALFSLLIGAAAPVALGSWFKGLQAESDIKGKTGRLILATVLTLALPAVLIAIWGGKAVLPLAAGAAIGVCLSEAGGFEILAGFALALAMLQWTGHATALAELSRDAKILFLIRFGASIAIPWLVIEAIVHFSKRPGSPSIGGGRELNGEAKP